MTDAQGFLVVLKNPETLCSVANKRYKGVNRMPCYRLANQDPIEAEVAAMEYYIFEGVRDPKTGLIASREKAARLLGMFEHSPRAFELIWCRHVCDNETESAGGSKDREAVGKRLGFDVAGLGGDFWSIVADLPEQGPVGRFAKRLNDCGLFGKVSDAREYLIEYQRLRLHDSDMAFAVLEVRGV